MSLSASSSRSKKMELGTVISTSSLRLESSFPLFPTRLLLWQTKKSSILQMSRTQLIQQRIDFDPENIPNKKIKEISESLVDHLISKGHTPKDIGQLSVEDVSRILKSPEFHRMFRYVKNPTFKLANSTSTSSQ